MSSTFDTYRLHYVDPCEQMASIRLLFVYANQKFDEIRCEKDDWCHVNSEIAFEQLPILEFNGVKYPPSFVIFRFLARKFRLTGKSDVDQLKCDILGEVLHQINQQYSQTCLLSFKNEVEKFEAQKLFLENYIPLQLKHLEQLFNTYSKDGIHFVGDTVTWIDLFVYSLIEKLFNIGADKQLLNNYRKLRKNRKAISKKVNIVNYLKSHS